MPVIQHNPPGVFPPYRAYSHANEIRGDARLLIISGLNGYREDGKTMPRSFEEQGYDRYIAGTAAKCDFCSQRVDAGLNPACVSTCPTNARIFGDLDDPHSAPSQAIAKRGGRPPLAEKGTKPKVYYID